MAIVEAGNLIKTANHANIYYIGSDNQRYTIPDEVTFLSWYKDFSGIKTVTDAEISGIPHSKAKITIKPGINLVKFPNGPQVYVAGQGATLRLLKNENIAKWYYGKDWSKNIKTLSLAEFTSYSFDKAIDINSKFSKTKTVLSAHTVNDELINRNLIQLKKTGALKSANINTEELPTLGRLLENLRADFEPGFSYNVNSYRINAAYEENVLALRPILQTFDTLLFVNDTTVENNTDILLKLDVGLNSFDVRLQKTVGRSFNYHIDVLRAGLNTNNTLNALSENLSANFVPAFNPLVSEYTLDANYNENMVVLKPYLNDNRSTYSIINTANKLDLTQASYISLQYGKNEYEINVRAENGAERKYKITINQRQFPTLDATDLNLITENLQANFTPAFTPNMTRYHLRANSGENRVNISVYQKYNNQFILINGTQTMSKSIDLSDGANEVEILVKIDGGHEKTYQITIDK